MKRNLNVTGKARKVCIRYMCKTKKYLTEGGGKRMGTRDGSEQGQSFRDF